MPSMCADRLSRLHSVAVFSRVTLVPTPWGASRAMFSSITRSVGDDDEPELGPPVGPPIVVHRARSRVNVVLSHVRPSSGSMRGARRNLQVYIANALLVYWIPAFAGMTAIMLGMSFPRRRESSRKPCPGRISGQVGIR